jgi:hypothetical protein
MLGWIRFKPKSKARSFLFYLVTLLVLIFFGTTVMAGSVTVSGTIRPGDQDISSPYYLWICEFRYWHTEIPSHQYRFTVSSTGTYLFMASNNNWGTAMIGIFEDSYSEENCLRSGQDGEVVDLVAGQSYVMSVWVGGNEDPDTGENFGGRYSVEISGPGDININTNAEETGDFVEPPDMRINWQYGDSNVVIYEHLDGVVVYCYNGNSWLGMLINQELVDNWDTDLPQETPVLEVNDDGCHAAFYILDTGEYQINIWSYEGKLYEIIADNLNFSNPTMRYHDPNE